MRVILINWVTTSYLQVPQQGIKSKTTRQGIGKIFFNFLLFLCFFFQFFFVFFVFNFLKVACQTATHT